MIDQEIEKIPKIQFKNQDPHQLQQDQLNHVDYQVHFLPFNLKLNQPAQVETLFNCTIRDYEKQEDGNEQEEQMIGNNKIVQTSLYGREIKIIRRIVRKIKIIRK
ncbi:hypothetical protein PPERSA_02340 [Pseudocohnilembus persalinus]|uniref:Uncharacterized protein n=1 Tax=Pseudocohnilembus persalinus TaxID=266149 RepID=A0A0V0QV07_PSEPJ|nr:hypothetical protein PPERSA_02340 [Pseudocohnilembus persalinus]|eukprot:KRX05808.1 hypothetical protein PPERSA_02340 [Pseudocohnilembus persalinus]